MPALREAQAVFAGALRDADVPTPSPLKGRLAEPPTKRFNVYRNNVTVSLVDAVVSAYPAVCKIVGEPFFRAMARAYVDQNPPRTPLMFAYAMDFPTFVAAFEPARQVPYLGDVARIEAARRHAYHAADVSPVGIETLSLVDPAELADLVFTLHPSLSLVRSAYPAFSIWFDSSEFGPACEPIDLSSPEDTLIVRPGLTVETRSLPVGGAAFIGALNGGETLGSAAEAATKDAENSGHAFDLAVHLTGLFQAGAVVHTAGANADTSVDRDERTGR